MTTTIKWQAMDNEEVSFSALPIIDLSWASSTSKKPLLLKQLHDALFNVGFLYIKNHGVPSSYISDLASLLPSLFDLPDKQKNALSKLNSPHFLGYSGFAEETTLGKQDLRENEPFPATMTLYKRSPTASSI